jgi:hypothetical protein
MQQISLAKLAAISILATMLHCNIKAPAEFRADVDPLPKP